jgi:RNA polymerase sigma-70 factor (ECF subfamily)
MSINGGTYTMLQDFSVEKFFNELFKEYFKVLCFFINKYTNDEEVSRDIAQDIFVKLWSKKEDFDSEMKVKAFLFISARNASLNYIRSIKVRYSAVPAIIDKTNKENSEFLVPEGNILANMIHTEFMAQIYKVIETLPEKRKKVFKLSYFHDLTNPMLAEYLDISIHTIKEHKGRALETLRLVFNGKRKNI